MWGPSPGLLAPSRRLLTKNPLWGIWTSCVATPTSVLARQISSTAPGCHAHLPSEKIKDLYSIMGVSPSATQQQIKEAYYRLSMQLHPDMGTETDHSKFAKLTEAYSILGQHDLRRKYDKGLLRGEEHQRHPHHAHPGHAHPGRAEPGPKTDVRGERVIFDFDEFYRAHYGEALRREQLRRREAERRRREAGVKTISDTSQRLLIVAVTLSVFLVVWVGVGRRGRGKASVQASGNN